MEQKFLQYVLYITLVELREKAYAENDARTFWLCKMLHNIPAALTSEDECRKAYTRLVAEAEHLEVQSWLDARKKEFFSRFPEFSPK